MSDINIRHQLIRLILLIGINNINKVEENYNLQQSSIPSPIITGIQG